MCLKYALTRYLHAFKTYINIMNPYHRYYILTREPYMSDFALFKSSILSEHLIERVEQGNFSTTGINIEKINSEILQHEFQKFEVEKTFWFPHQFSTERSTCYASGVIIGATIDSRLVAWFIDKAIIEIKTPDIHDVDFGAIDRYYKHRGVVAQILNYTIPEEISIIDVYTMPTVQVDNEGTKYVFGRKVFILAMLDDEHTESSFKIFKVTTNASSLTKSFIFK